MSSRLGSVLLVAGVSAILVSGCIRRPYSLEPTGIKSYDLALQKCLRSGKPMLIMISAPWCGACQTMQADLLQPGALRAMDHTIPYEIDFDSPRTKELRNRFYGGKGVPELILVSPEGKEIKRQAGWAGGDAFAEWVRTAIK